MSEGLEIKDVSRVLYHHEANVQHALDVLHVF